MLSFFKRKTSSGPNLRGAARSHEEKTASAQASLRSKLENALGPNLPGITGFGAGLDYETRAPALNVHVDSEATAKRVRARLPEQIRGFPVRVSQRARAVFD
jgi:hypothetical protein